LRRRERIVVDWTWEERDGMRWKLEELARKEEEKGK